MQTPERIESADEFQPTPQDQHRMWLIELEAAKASLRESRERGQEAIDRFLDKRGKDQIGARRLNLFTSNVQTLRSMLYGKVPSVTVTRRFGDAKDDVARVAGEILERCLNSDIERDGDGFKEAIGSALSDRLLPGIGITRLRYTVEMGEREVPPKMGPMPGMMHMAHGGGMGGMQGMDMPMMPGMADSATPMPMQGEMTSTMPMMERAPGFTEKFKEREDAETDYVFWNDFLYAPCRVWPECRWVAFGVPMTRADLISRFGEAKGKVIPLNAPANSYNDKAKDQEIDDVWGRAYIWEIWDKSTGSKLWLCEDYAEIIDTQKDTLGLSGFFPCPPPLMANVTTSECVPVPDYYLARDQYRELDEVTNRIGNLQVALAVRGVGDSSSTQLKSLLTGPENQIILVDNFAMLAERGGIKGVVDWFPLEVVAATLEKLEQYRDRLIQQLYQITGLSDIVRGQAQTNGTTATEQSIKARFASVRLQAMQDEVSRFASDCQKIRAEIICRHFDDETILQRANYVGGNDQELVGPALQLLRSNLAAFRIEIKPENINLSDAAALKSERMEALQMVGGFLANTAQLAQMDPKAAPLLTEMLTWAFAGFKGSSTIEGALDRHAADQKEAAMQPRPQMPPPQVMVAQMKGAQEKEKIQANLQADLAREQAKTRGAVTVQVAQAKADLAVSKAEEDARMRAEERQMAREAVEAFTGGMV